MSTKIYVIIEHYWGESQILNPIYSSESLAKDAISRLKEKNIRLGFAVDYEVDTYDLVETNDHID